jgi:hypothetical protein
MDFQRHGVCVVQFMAWVDLRTTLYTCDGGSWTSKHQYKKVR